MDEIKLGDKVQCIYTGFTGIAVAKTEFVNGCVQYLVAAKWNGKSKESEPKEIGIDSQSLKVLKLKRKPTRKEESTGGPSRRIVRRNF